MDRKAKVRAERERLWAVGCGAGGSARPPNTSRGRGCPRAWCGEGRQFWLLDTPYGFSPEVTARARELSCLRGVPLTRIPMGSQVCWKEPGVWGPALLA